MGNQNWIDPMIFMHSWNTGVPTNMAIPTTVNDGPSLYEVYITDRRYTDADLRGVAVEHIRADTSDAAKLKAILRGGYAESDLQYLDFGIHRRIDTVQPIDEDAVYKA